MDSTLVLLLAPLVVLEVAAKIAALVSLARAERSRGPKWAWAVAIVGLSTLGWVGWFLLGREEG